MMNADLQFILAKARMAEFAEEAAHSRRASSAVRAVRAPANGDAKGVLYEPRRRQSAAHEAWRGRSVFDRQDRLIGRVLQILVESPWATACTHDEHGASPSAPHPRYAAVRLGSTWLARLSGQTVLFPVRGLRERGAELYADVDLLTLQLALA